ncbi:MAG: hypothetical protein ACLFRD_01160 [Nitriliruptoraceae bacterium]
MSGARPLLLQTGPETFRVPLPDGRVVWARLAHHTRRGLDLPTLPPLTVATEMVVFLLERGALSPDDVGDGEHIDLGPAALRHPGAVDELRARLS